MTIDHADDQADELRDAADPDELGDSSDRIVGTIRPPGWLARIPALAWLFVGLATFDIVYRLWRVRFGLDGASPTNLIYLLGAVITGATTVLLPAAVLVGACRPGRARSWLLQGAVALAIAELVSLVAQDALTAVAGPPTFDPAGGLPLTSDFVVRQIAVQGPVLVLRMFGLAKIGLGLGAIAEPTRPLGRIVWALIVGTLATILVGVGVTLQSLQAQLPTAGLLALDLLIVAGVLIVAGLWAWIASVAARRDGRPWRTVLAAALAILLGSGIQTFGGLLAFQLTGTDDALTILTWSGLVAVAFGAVGSVLLVVAFATGFEPGDAAGSDDAGAGGEAAATDAPRRDAEL